MSCDVLTMQCTVIFLALGLPADADCIFSYRSSFHPGASSLSDGAARWSGETELSLWGRSSTQDILAL